ncbi:unnamed protein product [marine sediment metagenome]|uniref:Uncharacterized protein n=1 Tax=marine sediment metagenome TaxID=412755 RepID=X1LQV5_9ZZZZ
MVGGIKIISNPFLVEDGEPCEIKRDWRERLLSMPWKPWTATKTITPKIPMKKFLKLPNGTYMAHPQIVNEIKNLVSTGPGL